MIGKGAEVAVAVSSNYEVDHGPPTTRLLARAQPSASKRPQQEGHPYPWLDGYLQWLEGKEAREEYYGRLERMSVR